MAYRPNAKVAGGNSRMMVFNKIMLWTVTVMAVVMLANPQAVSGLFAMDSQFTADMERTVFRVEGMT